MASPSRVICRSHSMPYRPAMAAAKAEGVFSMMLLPSCNPRCANGRAISQPTRGIALGDFENAIHFDGGIARQDGDPHGRTGMASFVAEDGDHEIGGSVHHLRAFEKA